MNPSPKDKSGIIFKAIISIVISTAVALLLGEAVVRIVGPEILDPPLVRYLTWSSPHFRIDENGAVRYYPNEDVRFTLVHDGKVEFDVRYHTNNLGLIDHRDYSSDAWTAIRYAFVGDSFTAGMHGGTPWVPALRDHLESPEEVTIYNLGVSGTGFQHWEKLLTSVAEVLPYNRIVIITISSDFFRDYWKPLTENDRVRFCGHKNLDLERCRNMPRSIGYVVDPEISTAELEDGAFAEAHHRQAEKARDVANGRVSHLWALVEKSWEQYSSAQRKRDYNKAALRRTLASLQLVVETHADKPVTVIHLPKKEEVATGRYSVDPRREIEALGVSYLSALDECGWSTDMYHTNDGHPNALGYANISHCVSRLLGLNSGT